MKQRRHARPLNFLPRLSKRLLDKAAAMKSTRSMVKGGTRNEISTERQFLARQLHNYKHRFRASFRPVHNFVFVFCHVVQRVFFPSRFIFRGCGAIWLEVSDRRPVAFTNLPPPTPRHPRTTMGFSHFRVRARVAQHSKHANKSEHSMPRVDSIAPYL